MPLVYLCCYSNSNRINNIHSTKSNIEHIKINNQNIENLFLLGKIWGFLKYYHPNVAAGKFNWDKELFNILPELLKTSNNIDRNDLFCSWVQKFGILSMDSNFTAFDSSIVKDYPNVNWIKDTTILGKQLSDKLLKVYYAKRKNYNYYISLDQEIGCPEFTNEAYYFNISYPDIGFQLLALYRYWNIIQYFYPYKYLLSNNWDQILRTYIAQFIKPIQELDYKLSILSLIAEINDTHAILQRDDTLINLFKGRYIVPIEIAFIEKKFVVKKILDADYAKSINLKPGDIILCINDKNVEDIVSEKLKYTSASNLKTKLRNIAFELLRSNDTIAEIQFQRNATIHLDSINCFPLYKFDYTELFKKRDTCCKILNLTGSNGIAYINPSNIKEEDIYNLIKDISNTKGLIIDFRFYPSDFIVYELGKYFFNTKTEFAAITNGSIISPGLFTFNKRLSILPDNEQYYNKKIVLLVNEMTQSSAEFHCMAFKASSKTMIIGSTTAGADGNVSVIPLPGGIETYISGVGVYFPNGGETQRVGICPDIFIEPTINGIRNGKDELLEKAIELIENPNKNCKNNYCAVKYVKY